MIIPSIARGPNNGHEYCDNPASILEEAQRQGFSLAEIAKMADVDISTVRNWKRKDEAALNPIQRLANLLNQREEKMKALNPISAGTEGGRTKERVEDGAWRERRGHFISIEHFDEQGLQETAAVRIENGDYEKIWQAAVRNEKSVADLLKQAVKDIIRDVK